MKTYLHNTRYLAFAVFALLLCVCSCHRAPSEADRLLDRVDSLCYTDPDSAMALVSQIPDSTVSTWPEATRMRYHLMHIKALDKAYVRHTSDSIILSVVDFYKSRKSIYLTEAYYYAGRVCSDLGDAPRAIDLFSKSLETIDTTDVRPQSRKLAATIFSQMGTLNVFQGFFDLALKCYTQAYEYDVSLQDSMNICYDLRDIAETYRFLNCPDSAQMYCKRAKQMAVSISNNDLLSDIMIVEGSIWNMQKNYREAINVVLQALPNVHSASYSAAYSVMSRSYLSLNMLDSAEYYYYKIMDIGTVYAKESALRGLIEIALAKQNPQQARSFIAEYLTYSDSCNHLRQAESVEKARRLYNYHYHEKQASSLFYDNQQKKAYIFILAGFVLSLILGTVILLKNIHNQKRETRLQQIRWSQYVEYRHRQSEAYRKESTQKIAELEHQLSCMSVEKYSMRSQIQKQKEQIEIESQQQQAQVRQQELRLQELKSTDSYKKLQQLLQDEKPVKNDFWPQIQEDVYRIYPKFKHFLETIFFSEIETRVCILVKYDMAPADISVLVGRSRSSVTAIRKRLFQKVFGKNGKAEAWDDFIGSL